MTPFFDNVSDFITMGGYGFYVWLSYGISLLALIVLFYQSAAEKKKIFKAIHREIARQQRVQAQQDKQGEKL